jgi:hypothetical protein
MSEEESSVAEREISVLKSLESHPMIIQYLDDFIISN